MDTIFLRTKPAFKLALFLIIGLIIGKYVNFNTITIYFFLSALFIAALILFCVKIYWIDILFVIILIFVGILRISLVSHNLPPNHILNFLKTEKEMIVHGKMVNFPQYKNDKINIILDVTKLSINNKDYSAQGKILVKIKSSLLAPVNGLEFQIFKKVRIPDGERNPGDFNYKNFLEADGIYGIVNINKEEDFKVQLANNISFINRIRYFLKNRFFSAINQMYQGMPRALIKALLLGERGEISRDLNESFAKCGVIHALAISGLHIGFLSLIFYTLFSLLRFSYKVKIIAVIISLLLYNVLIGFEPPIARASLMGALFFIGLIIQRKTNIFNVISTAAIIILLINPLQLFQPAFQLSFSAVISIIYIYQQFKKIFENTLIFSMLSKFKVSNYFLQLLLVSVAAQLGTLPVTVYYFHRISLIGVLLNLLVIPIVGIIIALGFATLIFSLISIQIAQLYADTNSVLLNFLVAIVQKAENSITTSVEVQSVGLLFIITYYLLLWLCLNINNKKYRKALIFFLLIGANYYTWQSAFANPNWMYVTFLDVGQGDAAYIDFPDGENLLIDAGPRFMQYDAAKYFIVPFLKRQNVKKIDTIILSHADNDHIGGMPYIFRNMYVQKLSDPGIYHKSKVCSTYNFLIDSLKIDYQLAAAGENLNSQGNYEIYVLHPGKPYLEKHKRDVNNASVVVKIIYGKISFLFPGDIEKEAEAILTNYGELLRADVLKVAHHGSKTSSIIEFLELAKPEYAIISVGKDNKFKFPSPLTTKKLNKLKIKSIRTDQNGAVVFRTDGKRLQRIR